MFKLQTISYDFLKRHITAQISGPQGFATVLFNYDLPSGVDAAHVEEHLIGVVRAQVEIVAKFSLPEAKNNG